MSKRKVRKRITRLKRPQYSQRSLANAMHQALGEFLTDMGHVEFEMLRLMDYLNEAPLEAIFDEYSGQIFSQKIKKFKEWCDFGAADKDKPALDRIYKDLEELLPKRNFLVHGETWEGAFRGKPRQPYRVGLIKKHLEYLDEFEWGEHGPNVFDVSQVREVTRQCVRICRAIADMRNVR